MQQPTVLTLFCLLRKTEFVPGRKQDDYTQFLSSGIIFQFFCMFAQSYLQALSENFWLASNTLITKAFGFCYLGLFFSIIYSSVIQWGSLLPCNLRVICTLELWLLAVSSSGKKDPQEGTQLSLRLRGAGRPAITSVISCNRRGSSERPYPIAMLTFVMQTNLFYECYSLNNLTNSLRSMHFK